MSISNFWRKRAIDGESPKVTALPRPPVDTMHVYITAYVRWEGVFSLTGVVEEEVHCEAPYGELKLCENTDMRRAPIPSDGVRRLEMYEGYWRCSECQHRIDYNKRMNFETEFVHR